MKTSISLRIASVLTLLYCFGHSSGYPWTPVTGEQELAILEPMKSDHFDVMGAMRSYWDFYLGFGFAVSVFLLAATIILWQLASLAKRGTPGLQPMIVTFFIAFATNAFLNLRYFFIIPQVVAFAIAICLGIALFFSRKADPGSSAN